MAIFTIIFQLTGNYIFCLLPLFYGLYSQFSWGRQALIKPAQRKHFSYATIIGIFAIIITFIFRIIL
ncbi:hypothetical protein FC53_GL001577 [Limosilactobacillus reuteri subsp. reuteri]|nr:hypothetical protein FC53_GL001577 [Limosilactobacillus reuteri subsp. reuteri]